MGAGQLDIEIEQGAEFQLVVTVVGGPSSLAGYTGEMQIRDTKASSTVLYTAPGVTIDEGNRQVVVRIPHTATKDFTWARGRYDVLVTSGDSTSAYRVAEGKVAIDHSVTRES